MTASVFMGRGAASVCVFSSQIVYLIKLFPCDKLGSIHTDLRMYMLKQQQNLGRRLCLSNIFKTPAMPGRCRVIGGDSFPQRV